MTTMAGCFPAPWGTARYPDTVSEPLGYETVVPAAKSDAASTNPVRPDANTRRRMEPPVPRSPRPRWVNLISVQLSFPIAEPDAEARLQFLYDRLSSRFGFGPARVRLSRRKLTGGHIVYGRPHRITISEHLPPSEQDDTLRH